MAVTRNGLTPENHEIMRQAMLQRESSNNYQQPGNQFGFIGGYQMGGPALQDLGYVKKGTTNAGLSNPANWTGKDGITSKSDFLKSPDVQDKAFYDLSSRNYTALSKAGVINGNTSQEQVGGLLAAAHQNGAGSVIKNGLTGVDGNGQSGSAPYGLVSRSIAKGEVSPIKNVAQGKPPAAASSVATAGKDVYRGGNGVQASSLNSQSSVEVTSTTAQQDEISLPIVNVLEKYSSFNYLFTLSSLTSDAVNFPEKSYLAGDLGKIILSAGGREPFNRVSTAYVTKANPAGKYDFFIDDIQIDSFVGPRLSTKGSNSTLLTFKVTEPYSMGQFLQSCQLASFENGHLDYVLSPFLLTVDFVGYDSDGFPIKVPNSSRYIPINITQINMTVTASGCVYDVSASAWADISLNDSNNILKQNTAITGETVVNCLQNGTKSLEYIVNTRLQEIAGEKETNAKYLPNEIAIIFPDSTVVVGQSASDLASENNSSATVQSSSGSSVQTKLTLTRSDNILVQSDSSVSALGKAKMDFDLTRGGQFPKPGEGDAIIQGSGGVFKRNMLEPEANQREFVFRQGTSIVNAISEVMLMSEYCTGVITKKPDEKGFYDWFRIETQTFLLTPVKNNEGVNVTPKLLVYRVIPYKVHSSKFQAPGTKPVGYDKLKKEAVKEYNYIYTGKNVDVLSFDIKLEGAFFTSMYADGGRYNASAANATRDSQGVDETKPQITNNPDGKSGDAAEGNATVGTNPTRFKNADGSAAENYKTLVAKSFQERILNSNVAKVNATMTIMGDPYYIADSGTGNYSNSNSTSKMNLTSTGSIDYQSGEVDIIINFFTPVDVNTDGGAIIFAKDIDKKLHVPFSGLYQVTTLKNLFSKGKFTQELTLVRRPNQDPVEKDEVIEEASTSSNAGKPADPNAPENNNSAVANGSTPNVVESSDPGKLEPGLTDDPNAASTFEHNSGQQ